MQSNVIQITRADLKQIRSLLRNLGSQPFEDLQRELNRAQIVADHNARADLVTINSAVTYYDEYRDITETVTLVHPSQANFARGRVSVLSNLGTALLGLHEGQHIYWTFPYATTKLTVLRVVPNVSYRKVG